MSGYTKLPLRLKIGSINKILFTNKILSAYNVPGTEYAERIIFLRGGKIMRKNGKPHCRIGCLVALLGVFVLLALILPSSFWWFVLGAFLIYLGLCVIRW